MKVDSSAPAGPSGVRRAALLAAAGYAALGFVWILFSDQVVRAILDPERMTTLQSAKGLAFVALSAVYIFAVAVRMGQRFRGEGEEERGRRLSTGAGTPILVFAVLALAIGGTGLLLHKRSVAQERSHALESLSISAEAKAARVGAWLDALVLDARLLATDSVVRRVFTVRAADGASPALREQAREEVGRYLEPYPTRSVLVLDSAGRPLETVGEAVRVGPRVQAALERVRATGAPAIAELRTEPGVPLVLKVVAPVQDLAETRTPVGFVLIGVDVAEQLDALKKRWPASSRTEETVIVRRDGDQVVFITEMSSGPGSSSRLLRLPASGGSLAARALRGEERPEEGPDYRGVPSLGAVRRIQGTDWVLVVEMEQEEVFGPVRRRLAWTALFLSALLLAAAATTLSWWRTVRGRQARREQDLEARREAVARHFAWLAESSNDVVFLTDGDDRIVEANDRAREAYGYTSGELAGMKARLLLSPERGEEEIGAFATLPEAGVAHVESAHRRKDGSVFPVDVSGRKIDVDGRPFVQHVVQDITERKRAEERIRRVRQLYELLSRANAAMVRTPEPEELAGKVCEIAVEAVGFRLAWFAAPDGPDGLRAVVAAGPARQIVRSGPLTLDPHLPSGRGPTATAMREGRLVVANDYLADGSTSFWHEEARQLGLRALASFPLPGPDRPRGVLAFGAGEAGYFDDEIVGILSGLAEDLAFAFEAHDREIDRRRAEDALRATTRRLLDAERLGRTGSFYADFASGKLTWSDGHYRLVGVSPESFTPTTEALLEHLHPDDREGMKRISLDGWEGRPAGNHEYRVVDPSGATRWISGTSEVQRDESGRPTAVFGAVQDVTERKLAEERQRLWQHVLEGSADGILVAGPDQRILMVNRAFETMSGYAAEEVIGRTPRFLGSGHHDGAFYRDMWSSLARTGAWRGEIQDRRKGGEPYPALLSITAVKDDRGSTTHYVAIYTDLTERVAALERIRFLSQRDPLTHFVNRAGLETQLARAFVDARRDGETLALAVLDIDRFSAINESLGGAVGDEILRAVAGRLAAAVRTRDVLARVGPDEFAVGLVSLRGPGAVGSALKKIHGAFAAPFDVAGRSIPLTASLGVALFPRDGEDAQALMRSADAALRRAKAGEGGAAEFFRREMTVQATEALEAETGLRRALARRELVLHFQAQVEVETGRLVGAEALVRWQDPERGLVLPDKFIPLAEERGLIVPLGEWVLRAVAEHLRRWIDEGLPPFVLAVNVSAAQFRSPDFEARLLEILDDTDVPPDLMELELTESVLARDVEAVAALLTRLRDRGVRIAIDDFGTGYSSLGYLRRFPLQRLKIDQAFVRDIWTDPSAAAIVRTVIGMARGLGLTVVAEGVEEKRQYSFLRFHGCDEAQGFFIHRPAPEEEFRKFVAAGSFDPFQAPES